MNSKPYASALVWLRRDLRVADNHALHQALQQAQKVYVVFVFDDDILQHLRADDRRISFIYAALQALQTGALPHLLLRLGSAQRVIPVLAQQLGAQAVLCNDDVEPQAVARDAAVRGALANKGIVMVTCKDHYVFGAQELLTRLGRPYSVYSLYKKAWLQRLRALDSAAVPNYSVQHPALAEHSTPMHPALVPPPAAMALAWPSLTAMGFAAVDWAALHMPTGSQGAQQLLDDFLKRIERYHQTRDFPWLRGPSYLSVHLRFGTISIRTLLRAALQAQTLGLAGASAWLNALIWRDFYIAVLAHFPHVARAPFRHEYAAIPWVKGKLAKDRFAAWAQARTGYPLVDAAMQQLLQSGYMHKRLRMVSASFLTKHLGVDYRLGEAFFAQHLNDFDLSANNGGWQWAASTGCDAQPWFRIFNPLLQSEKFDAKGKFIRRYLPQLAQLPDAYLHAPWRAPASALAAAHLALVPAGATPGAQQYPHPIVQHAQARQDCLARYGASIKHRVKV